MYLTLCPCLMLALILCLTLTLTLYPMLALYLTLALCPMLALAPHTPSSLSYLFTPLDLLSGCIQLDSALFHSFSPIIYQHLYHITHSCMLACICICTQTTPLLFSSLHTHIETVPYPLIAPSEPHRAFIVIKPHSSYFMIAAAP